MDGGWIRFFAQKPVAVPDDLRALKLFSWAGDPDTLEMWKAAGFSPVSLPTTELSTALQKGLVNGIGVPPQVAVISQYYTKAGHMTDLPWQLVLGATVVSKATWDEMPEDLKPALRQARAGGGTEAARGDPGERRAGRRGDEEAGPSGGVRGAQGPRGVEEDSRGNVSPGPRHDRAGPCLRRGAAPAGRVPEEWTL